MTPTNHSSTNPPPNTPTKKTVREQILSLRNQLEDSEVTHQSQKIIQNIKVFLQKEGKNRFKSCLIYYPFRNEVDLLPWAKELFNQSKIVLFPKITSPETLEAISVSSLVDFEKSRLGIPEPIIRDEENEYFRESIDIIIVPAVAYAITPALLRVGYGKGFYDRFLLRKHARNSLKIGVAYDLQVVSSFRFDEHDQPLDVIVTNSTIHKSPSPSILS